MSEPTPTDTSKKRRPWLLPVAVMVIAAVGIGVGVAVAANDDDDRADTDYSSQIANVQQACQDWMGSYSGTRPSGDWCGDMAGWMNQQLTDGQMMGPRMWDDPDRMLDTCRQWTSTSGSTGDAPRCDDMVAWMRGHAGGDWDNWMMNGSMMGR